jgi:hypothetical protein
VVPSRAYKHLLVVEERAGIVIGLMESMDMIEGVYYYEVYTMSCSMQMLPNYVATDADADYVFIGRLLLFKLVWLEYYIASVECFS